MHKFTKEEVERMIKLMHSGKNSKIKLFNEEETLRELSTSFPEEVYENDTSTNQNMPNRKVPRKLNRKQRRDIKFRRNNAR